MKKIGFIGLGNMGSMMVPHLINGGYTVSGFDKNQSILHELSKKGMINCKTLEDVVKNKDIIITMLPNGEVVESVISKTINIMKKSTVVIDSSTIEVETVIKISDLMSKKGLAFLDAPVSGGTVGAKNGTLTFMVGGNKKTFDDVNSLFNLMGSKSVFCGSSGSGQAVKLCNNMILAISMIGVSEALNMGKNLNLDLNILYEVISTATGSCWAINKYCPVPGVGPESPADNNFKPGFSAKLMSKDLKLAVNAARNSKSKINFGELAEKKYTKMANGNLGDKDFSAIIIEKN